MKSIGAEVRRRQGQRLERRARPPLPRVIEHHVVQVMPEGSQRPRGASWRKSGQVHWSGWGGHRLGENWGTIR